MTKELPKELVPVLAEIFHSNELGQGAHFEVVYHDGEEWRSYAGSDTFENGEQVLQWRYAKECFAPDWYPSRDKELPADAVQLDKE